MKMLFALTVSILFVLTTHAQEDTSYQEQYEQAYLQRISQTHINGFYIPEDVKDAMKDLEGSQGKEEEWK